MNCWSVSLLDAPAEPVGWVRPSAEGLAIKSDNEAMLPAISHYLSLLGGRFFSHAPIAGNQDNVRVVYETTLSQADKGYYPTLARKLTFHPWNSSKFAFRPAKLPKASFRGAKTLSESAWQSDLFKKPLQKAPACECICGAHYSLPTHICPKCGGEDPLGWALATFGGFGNGLCGNLAKQLAEGCRSPSLDIVAVALERFIGIAVESPALPDDENDNVGRSKALLEYYSQLFVVPEIDKKKFSALAGLRDAKYGAIIAACSRTAFDARVRWSPSAMGAWLPNEAFREKLITELSERWKQPIVELRDAYLKLFRAAAVYRPIEKSLQSVANRGALGNFWHDWAKPFLMGVSAAKTFGLSLAIKAGLGYMRSQKEQERYQAFASAVSEAITASETALQRTTDAWDSEARLFSRITFGMAAHLENMLFTEYAKTPHHEQKNFVIRLLSGLGFDASGIAHIRERGIRPKPEAEPQVAPESFSPPHVIPWKKLDLSGGCERRESLKQAVRWAFWIIFLAFSILLAGIFLLQKH